MRLWQITLFGFIIAIIGLSLWMQDYILIVPKTTALMRIPESTASQQVATLWYRNGDWQQQTIKALWTQDQAKNAATLVTQLITILVSERIMRKQAIVLNSFIDPTGRYLYLNFSRSPLSKNDSIAKKVAILQTICKTVGANCKEIQWIYFLVNNNSAQDYDLNLSLPWPATVQEIS